MDWSQDKCDMSKPDEMALWAILGFEWNDMRFPIAVPLAKGLSSHLEACGFVHDPDRQRIKFRRPYRGPQHQYNGSGRWVSMDTPDPEPVVVQDLSKATREEINAYKDQLRELGEFPAEPEGPKGAEVIE